MLYLINCTVEKTEYMCDKIKFERTHIVEAETREEAKEKVIKYYTDKTDEYSVYYSAHINYCNEMIK
jgi:hypothetical protein